jgi:DNA-binding transcriptional ArsR family regulator
MSKPSDVIKLFHKTEPLFVALGDPNRQQIVVQLLQTHKLSVNAITDATPLSRPAVSHHLKILAQAGLVSVERNGTQRLYHLSDESITQVDLLEELATALRECTNWQDENNL